MTFSFPSLGFVAQRCTVRMATVITINNPHSAVNFKWRHSFGNQKFHHGMMLKVH
jgi:hypothetical protein